MIVVRVVPRAKQAKIERLTADSYKAWVTEPPEDGRANERVRRLLADELDVPLRCVILKAGAGSRQKMFLIQEP